MSIDSGRLVESLPEPCARGTYGVEGVATRSGAVWANPPRPISRAPVVTILGSLALLLDSGRPLVHDRLIREPFELLPV